MNQIEAAAPKPTSRPSSPALGAYLWWLAGGALLGLGMVGLLTIGVFLLPLAIALIAVGLLWSPLRNQSAVALVGGLAATPLYLAWLNREGPGRVCETIKDVNSCSEQWSPWPFVAVALILLLLTVCAGAMVTTRRIR